MGLLRELKERYKILSIVGMAKNSGKTTALNHFIEEALDDGVVLGITSTGRDGESQDLVTGTEKPRVYLGRGTIVSVPTQLYDLSEAGLEILKMTDYHTSIGQLMLCRVAESGYVQIAGPASVQEHKKMCAEMFELGAELILIDGAIDRKSIAAPETSDAVVLATGAVLSRSINRVVQETSHIINLYRLPELKDREIRIKLSAEEFKNKICVIEKGEIRALELKTGLAAGRYIDDAIGSETEAVYIPGALTSGIIGDISQGKLKKLLIILPDPTKIFIDSTLWAQLCRKGMRVNVLRNIEVAAVTVNPFSPQGYAFEHETLLNAVKEGVPDIPVIDVRM